MSTESLNRSNLNHPLRLVDKFKDRQFGASFGQLLDEDARQDIEPFLPEGHADSPLESERPLTEEPAFSFFRSGQKLLEAGTSDDTYVGKHL